MSALTIYKTLNSLVGEQILNHLETDGLYSSNPLNKWKSWTRLIEAEWMMRQQGRLFRAVAHTKADRRHNISMKKMLKLSEPWYTVDEDPLWEACDVWYYSVKEQ